MANFLTKIDVIGLIFVTNIVDAVWLIFETKTDKRRCYLANLYDENRLYLANLYDENRLYLTNHCDENRHYFSMSSNQPRISFQFVIKISGVVEINGTVR